MNNKELLEQANARVEQLSNLANNISKIEEIIPDIRDKALYVNGYDIALRFGISTAEKISQDILLALITVKNERAAELERLLGIQPVPEIPPLAKETILVIGEGKPLPRLLPSDTPEVVFPGERKPAIINPEFEKAVQEMVESGKKSKSEKSSDKRSMTVDDVTRMYITEGKSREEIQNHYGVSKSVLNNFLYDNKIRKDKKKQDKPAEPEETERPTQVK